MKETNNEYTSTYRSINEVLSEELDNLVLLYGNSQDDLFNALGFRIIRTQRRIERLTQTFTLAANGNAGDSLDFGRLGENGHAQDVSNPGDDILQVFEDRERSLLEWGISVDVDGVLTGVESPSGKPVLGVSDASNRTRGWDPEEFDSYGAVLSDYTRADAPDPIPTTALSPSHDQGLFRIDSDESGRNSMRFAFLNTTGSQVTVDITAIGKRYVVTPIKDEQTLRQMVRGEGVKRRLATWGGLGNTSPNLPSPWFDYRVTLNEDEFLGPAARSA